MRKRFKENRNKNPKRTVYFSTTRIFLLFLSPLFQMKNPSRTQCTSVISRVMVKKLIASRGNSEGCVGPRGYVRVGEDRIDVAREEKRGDERERQRRSSRWSIARDSIAPAEVASRTSRGARARACRVRPPAPSGGYESDLWAERWERPRPLKWRPTPTTEPAYLTTRSCNSARRVRSGAPVRRATFSRPSARIFED